MMIDDIVLSVRCRSHKAKIRPVSVRIPVLDIFADLLTQREPCTKEQPSSMGDSLDLAVHIRRRLSGLSLVGFGSLFLRRRFAL